MLQGSSWADTVIKGEEVKGVSKREKGMLGFCVYVHIRGGEEEERRRKGEKG